MVVVSTEKVPAESSSTHPEYKKKGEAILIGFDDEDMVAHPQNPFANKPVLRSKQERASSTV